MAFVFKDSEILKWSITPRNFLYANFKDRYNQDCSLQESSLADEAAIWLGVDKDLNGAKSSRMHLTQEMAAELWPILKLFAQTGFINMTEEEFQKEH
jgi:hypothetical protein